MENCLTFGNDPKITNKKVARYLLGARPTIEVFKMYELRYLLLKIYPFIHNLFYNPRRNSQLEIKTVWNPHFQKQVETIQKYGAEALRKPWKPKFEQTSSFVFRHKNWLPQVLFASITPTYADIIRTAAQTCNMPYHQDRWLNGSMTAAISYQGDRTLWNYFTDHTQSQIELNFHQKWGANKENQEKTKEKNTFHGKSRWPALIIIPDVINNAIILNEAKKIGLPVIGLVNSDCGFEIDYPIFAQDHTLHSVYFFCNFLATLIAKEMVYTQHKRYTLQKTKKQKKKTRHLTFVEQKRPLKTVWKLEKRKCEDKAFFFKKVKPVTKMLENLKWLPRAYFFKQPTWIEFQSQRNVKKYKRYTKHQNFLHFRKDEVKKFLTSLDESHKRSLQLLFFYMMRKTNGSVIWKKLKYLTFFYDFIQRRRSSTRRLTRMLSRQQIISSEAHKKNCTRKKNVFWTQDEQKRLWKTRTQFLIFQKLKSLQSKLKKFRVGPQYMSNSSYFWVPLQHWTETLTFQNPKYTFPSLFAFTSFMTLTREKQFDKAYVNAAMQKRYWDKQVRNRMSKIEKQEKAKKGWAKWTQQNKQNTSTWKNPKKFN